jgi:hypothetical protein
MSSGCFLPHISACGPGKQGPLGRPAESSTTKVVLGGLLLALTVRTDDLVYLRRVADRERQSDADAHAVSYRPTQQQSCVMLPLANVELPIIPFAYIPNRVRPLSERSSPRRPPSVK